MTILPNLHTHHVYLDFQLVGVHVEVHLQDRREQEFLVAEGKSARIDKE
jgi:hypothetical protein